MRDDPSYLQWHKAFNTLDDVPSEHASIAKSIQRAREAVEDCKEELVTDVQTDGRSRTLGHRFNELVVAERRWEHLHEVVSYLIVVREHSDGKLKELLADRSAGRGVTGELPTALALVMYETWRASTDQGSNTDVVQQARIDLRAEVDQALLRGQLDGLRTFNTDAALALLNLGQAAWRALESK